MGIFVLIVIGFSFSAVLFLMSIANLFDWQKPQRYEKSFDSCLLSRYEIEKRLWKMRKGQKIRRK